jgi:hypothetical protein
VGDPVPISYEIFHDARLVVATVSGVMTGEDLSAYQTDVWTREELAGYDEIVDLTGVESFDYQSGDQVKELARLAGKMDVSHHPGRLAIVAPSVEAFGLARMYQTYREMAPGNKVIKVLKSMAEARDWLTR